MLFNVYFNFKMMCNLIKFMRVKKRDFFGKYCKLYQSLNKINVEFHESVVLFHAFLSQNSK